MTLEMTASQTIHADRVRLRLLTADDLGMTLAWRNRDDVRRWFKQSELIDMALHTSWFEAHQLRDDALMFIVEDATSGTPVGQVSIYHIDRDSNEAEVGRFIAAPSASGKGYIRAAIIALVAFAFEELGLSRVYLEVFANNARAIGLYESVGFMIENTHDEMVYMSMQRRA